MKKYYTIAKFFIVFLTLIIVVGCVSYKIGIGPVNKSEEKVDIIIPANSTYLSIAPILKENNLIKSETFYKVYIKIFKPNHLQAGNYTLSSNMGVKKIVDLLENNNTNGIRITIPEGKHIKDVAKLIEEKTTFTSEEILTYWQSSELLDKVITKYWFITDEVKNSKLRYALEGYFFPDTYEILKTTTKEEITYKMLNRMDEILTTYKKEIDSSSYSVHEILTLASIVEHEAVLDSDRPIVAGVFFNRLEKDMKLQSCATIGYAIDEWKLTYNNKDLQTDSPYNTYLYGGLPVGPGGLPGKKSIEAVINPDKNDYLYFLADVFNGNEETHYAKTYPQHQQNCLKYLGISC